MKFLILALLLGKKNLSMVKPALFEYKKLLQFRPMNILESYLQRPSDIWEHLVTLYMLTVEFDLKTVLELGTAEGESTIAFLQATKKIGGKVYSIDINPCLEAQKIVESNGLQDRWTFIQNDDLQVNWEKKIDHLFIDTSHEFQHTLNELKKYETYVRNGGIISLHDIITFPSVMKAVNEFLRGRNDLRVYKYLHNNGLVIIFKGHSIPKQTTK